MFWCAIVLAQVGRPPASAVTILMGASRNYRQNYRTQSNSPLELPDIKILKQVPLPISGIQQPRLESTDLSALGLSLPLFSSSRRSKRQ